MRRFKRRTGSNRSVLGHPLTTCANVNYFRRLFSGLSFTFILVGCFGFYFIKDTGLETHCIVFRKPEGSVQWESFPNSLCMELVIGEQLLGVVFALCSSSHSGKLH